MKKIDIFSKKLGKAITIEVFDDGRFYAGEGGVIDGTMFYWMNGGWSKGHGHWTNSGWSKGCGNWTKDGWSKGYGNWTDGSWSKGYDNWTNNGWSKESK